MKLLLVFLLSVLSVTNAYSQSNHVVADFGIVKANSTQEGYDDSSLEYYEDGVLPATFSALGKYSFYLVLGILVLFVGLFYYRTMVRQDDNLEGSDLFIFISLFLLTCICELILGYLIYKKYATYEILDSMGQPNVLVMILISITGMTVTTVGIYNQLCSFFNIMDDIQSNSNYYRYRWSLIGFLILAVIYLIADYAFKEYIDIVRIGFVAVLVIQMGILIYRLRSYPIYLLTSVCVYLIGLFTCAIMAVAFLYLAIGLLVFLLIAASFFGGTNNSVSKSSPSNSTAPSYFLENGESGYSPTSFSSASTCATCCRSAHGGNYCGLHNKPVYPTGHCNRYMS